MKLFYSLYLFYVYRVSYGELVSGKVMLESIVLFTIVLMVLLVASVWGIYKL